MGDYPTSGSRLQQAECNLNRDFRIITIRVGNVRTHAFSSVTFSPVLLWENLHQSNPPIPRTATTKISSIPTPPEAFARATGCVAVGDGVKDGLGEGVTATSVEVGVCGAVAVAGGVTIRSNFCSGRMTEALFNPFQDIKSAREMPYQPAIHESVSPLLTI